jgi:hypothetical protein
MAKQGWFGLTLVRLNETEKQAVEEKVFLAEI